MSVAGSSDYRQHFVTAARRALPFFFRRSSDETVVVAIAGSLTVSSLLMMLLTVTQTGHHWPAFLLLALTICGWVSFLASRKIQQAARLVIKGDYRNVGISCRALHMSWEKPGSDGSFFAHRNSFLLSRKFRRTGYVRGAVMRKVGRNTLTAVMAFSAAMGGIGVFVLMAFAGLVTADGIAGAGAGVGTAAGGSGGDLFTIGIQATFQLLFAGQAIRMMGLLPEHVLYPRWGAARKQASSGGGARKSTDQGVPPTQELLSPLHIRSEMRLNPVGATISDPFQSVLVRNVLGHQSKNNS